MNPTWKTFTLRTLLACIAIFATMRLALARDGSPGGAARSFVTVAGTLTGVTTPTVALTFTFHRPGGAMLCAPRVENVTLGAGGAFQAQVPIEAPGCPATLFDGSDVQVDVAVGAETVARNAAINPVPYAHYASQYGTPDCPVGYERLIDRSEGFGEADATRLCVRQNAARSAVLDEVVRVGDGPAAFWIDRYEATVWSSPNGDGTPLGTTSDDYPAGFPDNGQWGRPPGGALATRLLALSRAGAWRPSANLTWFQAQAACRASGKRLPSGEEWLAAANGTDDLLGTTSDGADGRCVTISSSARVATRTRCKSLWGAQDMIGNLAEYTSDWLASVGRSAFLTVPGALVVGSPASNGGNAWPVDASIGWPSGVAYGNDRTASVESAPVVNLSQNNFGVPSVVARGGGYRDQSGAGVFYYHAGIAPVFTDDMFGFRCVIPR